MNHVSTGSQDTDQRAERRVEFQNVFHHVDRIDEIKSAVLAEVEVTRTNGQRVEAIVSMPAGDSTGNGRHVAVTGRSWLDPRDGNTAGFEKARQYSDPGANLEHPRARPQHRLDELVPDRYLIGEHLEQHAQAVIGQLALGCGIGCDVVGVDAGDECGQRRTVSGGQWS